MVVPVPASQRALLVCRSHGGQTFLRCRRRTRESEQAAVRGGRGYRTAEEQERKRERERGRSGEERSDEWRRLTCRFCAAFSKED
eukprot:411333-Hanusia_phi.AAC.1